MAPLPAPAPANLLGNLWDKITGHSIDHDDYRPPSYTPPSDLALAKDQQWAPCSFPAFGRANPADVDVSAVHVHYDQVNPYTQFYQIAPYVNPHPEIDDHLHFLGQPGNLQEPVHVCSNCQGTHDPEKAHYPQRNHLQDWLAEQGTSGMPERDADDNTDLHDRVNSKAMYSLGHNPDISAINWDSVAPSTSGATRCSTDSLQLPVCDDTINDSTDSYHTAQTSPQIANDEVDIFDILYKRQDYPPNVEEGEDDFWQLDKRSTGTIAKRAPLPARTPLGDITNIPRPEPTPAQPATGLGLERRGAAPQEVDRPPTVEEGEDDFWQIGKRSTGTIEKRAPLPQRTPLGDITNLPRPELPPRPRPEGVERRDAAPQDIDYPPTVGKGEDDFWQLDKRSRIPLQDITNIPRPVGPVVTPTPESALVINSKRSAIPQSDEDDKPPYVAPGEDDFWQIGKRGLEKRTPQRTPLGDITNIPRPPKPAPPPPAEDDDFFGIGKRDRIPFADTTDIRKPNPFAAQPVSGGTDTTNNIRRKRSASISSHRLEEDFDARPNHYKRGDEPNDGEMQEQNEGEQQTQVTVETAKVAEVEGPNESGFGGHRDDPDNGDYAPSVGEGEDNFWGIGKIKRDVIDGEFKPPVISDCGIKAPPSGMVFEKRGVDGGMAVTGPSNGLMFFGIVAIMGMGLMYKRNKNKSQF